MTTRSDPNLVYGGWVSFDVAEPQGFEVVQQYLGAAVMEHSNPPDWAFPTERWRGKKDSAATYWRYVYAPNAGVTGAPRSPWSTRQLEETMETKHIGPTDARLIAAAPELLEALKKVAQSLEWHAHGCCRGIDAGGPLPTNEAVELAKRTIAKATGHDG